MRRRTAWLLLILATLVAFALRAFLGLDTLFDDGVRPFSDDPPYHLMRTQALLTGTLDPAALDPRVAWPRGATACWPTGFAHLLAGVARVAGVIEREDVARVTAWVPPVLGALLIPLTYLLAAHWTGRGWALAVATSVALLPAHVSYSLLGRADHHVLEPLFLVLGLLGPSAILARRRWGRAGRLLAAVGSGVALGASFAFIPAALPWVVLGLGLPGFILAIRDPVSAVAFGSATVLATAASLVLSPWPNAWVFYAPSRVHLAAVGALSSGLIATAIATVRRVSFRRTAAIGIAVAAFVLGSVALIAPGFREGLVGGLDYLAAGSFAALSLEARSLLADPARTARLITALAPLMLAGVLARSMGAACASGSPSGAPRLFPLEGRWLGIVTLFALLLAVAQRRFLVGAVPLLALALVDGIVVASRFLSRLTTTGRFRVAPALRAALVGAFVLLGAAPAMEYLAVMTPLTPTDRVMYRTADRMRAEIGAPTDGTTPPRHGALVPWGHGHVFQWSAGVGTVCDNFFGVPESDRAMARCLELLYADDPAKVPSMLSASCVSYVVLTPPHPRRVRVESTLMGQPADRFVDDADRFTPAFARTFQAVVGMWGAGAAPGAVGPWDLRLVDRIEERNDSGEVQAQALLFHVPHRCATPLR